MNATSKLVKAWESKNAKNAAKAGGISLMALSLAACGGSSTTTTTPVVETPAVETPVVETPVVVAGESIAMTSSVDAATGGAGDDTITASLIGAVSGGATVYTAATATLNAGDTIDGGAGDDVLNLTISGSIDGGTVSIPAALITAVETINVRAVTSPAAAGDNLTFDAINTSGVTALNVTNSTDSVVFTNVPTAATIGVSGNNAMTLGDVTFTYATATTAPIINISGGTKADTGTDITNGGSGAAAATINSTGEKNAVDVVVLSGSQSVSAITINATTGLSIGAADNVVGLADSGIAADATITVTGAGAVDLNTLAANVKTVDASGSTGGVTATLGAGADVFTGGSGDDFVTLADAAQTGLLSGGTGTDTLAMGDSDLFDIAAEVTKISGFETLRVLDDNATAEDYQVNLLSGITKIEVGAVNDASDDVVLSGLNATQAANVHVIGDNAGDLDLVLTTATGTTDVATVTLGSGLTTTEAYDIAGDLNVTGFETLNLVSNPGVSVTAAATKVASIGTLTSTTATAVNMTGGSITLTNGTMTKAATYDGTALTGVLSVAGDLVAGSTVKGSAGKDVFTISLAGSTYIGNASDDQFNVAAVADLESSGVFTTITGGDGTKDELDFTADAAHTIVDSNFKNVTGLEVLNADTDAGGNAFSLTTSGFFNTAFASGVTSDFDFGDAAVTISAATYAHAMTLDIDVEVVDEDVNITTGDGADTITLVSDAMTTAQVNVSTGAGDDTVKYTHSSSTLVLTSDLHDYNLGAGKDTLEIAGYTAAEVDHVVIAIGAGESTLDNFDVIKGYVLSAASIIGMKLDFAGSADHASAVTNNAVTGYQTSELLITSDANAKVTFSGSKAAALTAAEKAAAVQDVFTTANDTALFTHGSDTYVFHNSTAGDSLVMLEGVTGVGLDTDDHIVGEVIIA